MHVLTQHLPYDIWTPVCSTYVSKCTVALWFVVFTRLEQSAKRLPGGAAAAAGEDNAVLQVNFIIIAIIIIIYCYYSFYYYYYYYYYY